MFGKKTLKDNEISVNYFTIKDRHLYDLIIDADKSFVENYNHHPKIILLTFYDSDSLNITFDSKTFINVSKEEQDDLNYNYSAGAIINRIPVFLINYKSDLDRYGIVEINKKKIVLPIEYGNVIDFCFQQYVKSGTNFVLKDKYCAYSLFDK